jgi:hypothetical protein
MLREMAISWVRTNVLPPKFHRDFERRFDERVASDKTVYLAVGAGLVKDGKPRLIHCFWGEFFVFEIPPRQAWLINLAPHQVLWGSGLHPDCRAPLAEPVIELRDLEIEQADHLNPDIPLIIHVTTVSSAPPPGRCSFRLDYDLPGRRSATCWQHYDWTSGRSGRLKLEFSPVRKGAVKNCVYGPIAMFLRLCTWPDPTVFNNRDPISNIATDLALLAVEPPGM